MQGAPGKRVLWQLLARHPVFLQEHLDGAPTAGSGLRGGSGARRHVCVACLSPRADIEVWPITAPQSDRLATCGMRKFKLGPSSDIAIQRQLGDFAACRLVASSVTSGSPTPNMSSRPSNAPHLVPGWKADDEPRLSMSSVHHAALSRLPRACPISLAISVG
jgi:hypothetical protein